MNSSLVVSLFLGGMTHVRWEQSPCHPLQTTLGGSRGQPAWPAVPVCENQSTPGGTQSVIPSTVGLTETSACVLNRTTEAREWLSCTGREMQEQIQISERAGREQGVGTGAAQSWSSTNSGAMGECWGAWGEREQSHDGLGPHCRKGQGAPWLSMLGDRKS